MYNIDPSTQKIDKHIIRIMECADKNNQWKDFLPELFIAYLEFGFDYDKHKALFDRLLALRGLSKEMLDNVVRKDLMQFKLSKRNIAINLHWTKKTNYHKTNLKKAAVVEKIYQLCRNRDEGIYEFRDAVSCYRLIITVNIIRLENVTKGLVYHFN